MRVGCEGVGGRHEGDGGEQTHGKVVRFEFTDLLRQVSPFVVR